MKKQESIIQLVLGLIGVVFCFVLPKMAYLPSVLIGVLAVIMIRRIKSAPFTEAEHQYFRKVNTISLICWVIFALLGFFLLRDERIGADGQWFLLSAYLFITIHGTLMLLPTSTRR